MYHFERDIECKNGGKWHVSNEICICNYSWTGNDCSLWRHHLCYFGIGNEYRGDLSTTKSGFTCALWTTDHNNDLHPIGENGVGVHNLCRNPDNDPQGIWCYIEGQQFMDYCNGTVCPDEYKIANNLTLDESNTKSDNPTVKFLFGPLISGVCGGIVALLVLSGFIEYLRRNGCFERKKGIRKKERNFVNNGDENAAFDGDLVVSHKLGGVVTVNVDTGEHMRQNSRAGNLTVEDSVSVSSNKMSSSVFRHCQSPSSVTNVNLPRNAGDCPTQFVDSSLAIQKTDGSNTTRHPNHQYKQSNTFDEESKNTLLKLSKDKSITYENSNAYGNSLSDILSSQNLHSLDKEYINDSQKFRGRKMENVIDKQHWKKDNELRNPDVSKRSVKLGRSNDDKRSHYLDLDDHTKAKQERSTIRKTKKGREFGVNTNHIQCNTDQNKANKTRNFRNKSLKTDNKMYDEGLECVVVEYV